MSIQIPLSFFLYLVFYYYASTGHTISKHTNIYIYTIFTVTLQKNKKQNKSGINLKTHIIRFWSFNTTCNMQYAESLHEIVIRGIHYDSKTSSDFIECVHYVHVTQTTGYHTILTILIQIFHIFSQIHILFSKPLFCFLRCVQTPRKKTLLSLFLVQ